MNPDTIAQLLLALLIGGCTGSVALWLYNRFKLRSYQHLGREIVAKAEIEAGNARKSQEITLKQTQLDQQREIENLWQNERKKIQREEARIKLREDKQEERMTLIEKKITDVEKRESMIVMRKDQIEEEKKQLAEAQKKLLSDLERTSGLSCTEAKDLLLARITNDIKAEAANLMRRIKKEAEEQGENEARRIIATAINRMVVPCVSETTVHTIAIPNDEMKGRIIGREGRNIRAMEQATGINFIIDDTPNAVVLSGYDPIRMHIAKTTLTELVADGRIYPTRIEEVVEKAKINVAKEIKQHGEDAALRAGIMNLHPELITLLGKLKFRFSYGQNVLEHSLEVSHLMGLMAAELGLDIRFAKRIGLLHDMGKAVSHEVEGSHAVIGHDLALRYGETKEVANGIGCHHYEMEAMTLEGSLCSAADAISASRPGARIEAVEEYIKRLTKLEDIAAEFAGVGKAYAMQAGRELRVFVVPSIIDDDGLVYLARDLTKRIEQELSYPGKIKVTVSREKRVVEYAI